MLEHIGATLRWSVDDRDARSWLGFNEAADSPVYLSPPGRSDRCERA
jgi:hypothetical protein